MVSHQLATVLIHPAIANIVGASSKCQSLKGVLTAGELAPSFPTLPSLLSLLLSGPVKTTVYSYEKIQKMFKSMQSQK